MWQSYWVPESALVETDCLAAGDKGYMIVKRWIIDQCELVPDEPKRTTSEKLTDEEFIALARKSCRNTVMEEALMRLGRANALIGDIKDFVRSGGVTHVSRIYSMIKQWEWEQQ